MNYDINCVVCGGDSMPYVNSNGKGRMCIDCGFDWILESKQAEDGESYFKTEDDYESYFKTKAALEEFEDFLETLVK